MNSEFRNQFITRIVWVLRFVFRRHSYNIINNICKFLPVESYQQIAVAIMEVSGPEEAKVFISRLFSDGKTLEKMTRVRKINQHNRNLIPKTLVDPRVKKIILHRVVSTFEKHGVKSFICFGTLLGLVRDNEFMEHDTDLDIGIFYNDHNCELIKQILENNGFEITYIENDPWPCRIIARITELSLNYKIDIVFFRYESDRLLTYSRIYNHILIRERHPFSLKKTEFTGISVWIPDSSERFLDENYGNWIQKADFYHYIFSSACTDMTDAIVNYYLAETILKFTINGSEKLIHLLLIAKKNYGDELVWGPIVRYSEK